MTSSVKSSTFCISRLASMALLLSVCAAPAAFAQTPTAPAAGAKATNNLKAMDLNKDGQLSREEIKGRPRLEKNFDAIDTNKDGQLSRDELKAYREAHKGQAKK